MLDLACKDEILETKLRSKPIFLQIRSTYKFNLQKKDLKCISK
jgi:hypothetical protein